MPYGIVQFSKNHPYPCPYWISYGIPKIFQHMRQAKRFIEDKGFDKWSAEFKVVDQRMVIYYSRLLVEHYSGRIDIINESGDPWAELKIVLKDPSKKKYKELLPELLKSYKRGLRHKKEARMKRAVEKVGPRVAKIKFKGG